MTFLKENWVLKLLALGAAILLAVFVYRDEDRSRATFNVSPSIQAPPGQRVKEPLPGFIVRVELEGRAPVIRQITNADLRVTIDTTGLRPGRRTSVPINVSLPEKFQDQVLIDWRPRSVQVRFESDAQKELPVLVKPLNPPEGWEMRETPTSNPGRVTVSGPQELVNRVASIVAPFVVGGDERISTQATLQALAADGSLIPDDQVRIEPPQVTISGLQERVVLQKRVPVQPNFRIPGALRVTVLSITPPQAQIVGSKRLVSDIYVVETAPIQLPNAAGEVTREVALVQPGDGVELTPSQVRVRLRLQTQGGR